jgi:YegS/Rv2252/BmrU family lipid kinase
VELLTGPVLLVANPGARRAERNVEGAVRAFTRAGVRVVVVMSRAPGHAGEIAAREGGSFGAVFTLGGDGTAIEVIGALAGSGVPVGILPGGTGNLVARSLGTPLDVERAVPALLAGEEADVDLGVLNGAQRFAFTVGVGVDARMIELTPPALKRRWGWLAYATVAAREALSRHTFRVRAEVDGEVVECDATAVMIANFGVVLGDLLHLGPGIAVDDGLLDLCVFAPRGAGEALGIVWRLFRKDFRPHPGLLYRKGRRFRVECDPPQTVQADGEVRGRSPVEIVVEPRAARLLRPRRDPGHRGSSGI